MAIHGVEIIGDKPSTPRPFKPEEGPSRSGQIGFAVRLVTIDSNGFTRHLVHKHAAIKTSHGTAKDRHGFAENFHTQNGLVRKAMSA
jgi:hypothetical protein